MHLEPAPGGSRAHLIYVIGIKVHMHFDIGHSHSTPKVRPRRIEYSLSRLNIFPKNLFAASPAMGIMQTSNVERTKRDILVYAPGLRRLDCKRTDMLRKNA